MSFAFFSDYAGSSSGFYALLHYNDTSIGPISKVKNCSPENPCNANEGRCHNDNSCMSGYLCGHDNCPTELEAQNCTNCCYEAPTEPLACNSTHPCYEDQGHCNLDDDCNGTLHCGQDNCPKFAGYANGTNCCYDYCAKWLDLSTGTLTSPNFPNNYDSNTVCGWHLEVQENKVITIEINSFRVSFTFIFK